MSFECLVHKRHCRTNSHGNLIEGEEMWDDIPLNEKGINLIKGFLVIVWYASQHNFSYLHIWSGEQGVGVPFLNEIMTRDMFWKIWKHFRIVDPQGLPKKDEVEYKHVTVEFLFCSFVMRLSFNLIYNK